MAQRSVKGVTKVPRVLSHASEKIPGSSSTQCDVKGGYKKGHASLGGVLG